MGSVLAAVAACMGKHCDVSHHTDVPLLCLFGTGARSVCALWRIAPSLCLSDTEAGVVLASDEANLHLIMAGGAARASLGNTFIHGTVP